MAKLFTIFTGVLLLQGLEGNRYGDSHCAAGRSTITHLFEWKWSDVLTECERFLGPYGYCGVQVSPPNENAIVTNPNRPWYERYQPVSYNLSTRSGDEHEFRDMVDTCNKYGVRIYVDAVINHMTGAYSGTGTGGSTFDGTACSYPGVPYGHLDCNGPDRCDTCDGNIHNFNDPYEVRNCKLLQLSDLRLDKEYVRGKLTDYLNKLIDIGVAGFRVDAAKHMWPDDLEIIFSRLNYLNKTVFGPYKHPFVFQEVIDMGGEAIRMKEYFNSGRVTNFIYGVKLANIFLRRSDEAKWLVNWGEAWGMPASDDVVVFISNHDNQRGHGGGGSAITFFEDKEMKIATAFMLAHPYGFPRVMSSYYWDRRFSNGQDENNWVGPPHNEDMSIKPVKINADMTCGNGWVCEHRWRQVYNMVAFRNVVGNETLHNFQAHADFHISLSRGDKGFIAIVADGGHLNSTIYTALPGGDYCDVISGNYENGDCTGKVINVNKNGNAALDIHGLSEDPVVAIHVGARIGSPKKVTT